VLYFAKLYHRGKWVTERQGLITCYSVSVLAIVGLMIIVAILYTMNASGGGGDSDTYRFLDRMHYFTSGFYFAILLSLAVFYIYQLFAISHSSFAVRASGQLKFCTFLIFLIFLSRCLFDFAAAFGLFTLHICKSSCATAGLIKEVDPLPFAVLLLWELCPVLIVLVYCACIFRPLMRVVHVPQMCCCVLCLILAVFVFTFKCSSRCTLLSFASMYQL
jgi:hypothetical protein